MLLTLLASAFIIGCSDDNPSDSTQGMARMSITAFDAPPPEGIEHLYLNIVEVSVHNEDNGWMVLSDIDTTIDFLELINGVSVNLVDDSVPSGFYSQLRLVVSDSNEIVVDSVSYPLTIPSGTQTGVKLNLDFNLNADEFVHLYVDFDVSKSVIVANNEFKLKPTYRVFKEDLSGTISGTVTDTLSNPIANVMVEAASTEYSTATLTDSLGAYMLILPTGSYDLSAMLDSTSVTDTTYIGVLLNAGDSLSGYDFIVQ